MSQSEIQFKDYSLDGNTQTVRMLTWNNTDSTIETQEFLVPLNACFCYFDWLELMGYETEIWTNTNFDWYLVLHSSFCDVIMFQDFTNFLIEAYQ